MSHSNKQFGTDEEQASTSQPNPEMDDQERLRTAYGGVKHVTEFHAVVKQDGELYAVPSGGAIQCPPTIEMVYVVFKDGIDYQNYVVDMEADITSSSNETDSSTQRVHRLRNTGSSEWDEPWAVEAALEERPGGWIVPTELRFEGLALHVQLNEVVKQGVVQGPNVFEDLV